MKFEIRQLKIARSLSEETIAFTANLYVDGRRIGSASNHGTGGNTNVHIDRTKDGARNEDMRDRVRQYAMATLDAVALSQGPRRRYVADDPSVIEGRAAVGDWIGDPIEELVDHLVHAADEAQEKARFEKRIAKMDAKVVAIHRAKGLGTIRVERDTGRQVTTEWFAFDTDPKAAADAAILKMRHKAFPDAKFTWKVVS